MCIRFTLEYEGCLSRPILLRGINCIPVIAQVGRMIVGNDEWHLCPSAYFYTQRPCANVQHSALPFSEHWCSDLCESVHANNALPITPGKNRYLYFMNGQICDLRMSYAMNPPRVYFPPQAHRDAQWWEFFRNPEEWNQAMNEAIARQKGYDVMTEYFPETNSQTYQQQPLEWVQERPTVQRRKPQVLGKRQRLIHSMTPPPPRRHPAQTWSLNQVDDRVDRTPVGQGGTEQSFQPAPRYG